MKDIHGIDYKVSKHYILHQSCHKFDKINEERGCY